MGTPADNAPQQPPRRLLRLVATLVIAGVVATLVLTLISTLTRDRIARNEQAWIQQYLDALVPPASHDNDLLSDGIAVVAPELLGSTQPIAIYRARKDGMPVAAIVRSTAPDGYRGPIELLVAIAYDGTLLGVRVLRHHETPGLGDAFEKREPHWLEHFRGRSLADPPQQRWTVRKDGGDFDAFTGATITPRAIVKEIRRTLEYYQANRERIFSTRSGAENTA